MLLRSDLLFFLKFYDFLSNLDFGVKIVGSDGYYYCDEQHGWGFNQATVYIKEKIKEEDQYKICSPKTYIGTVCYLLVHYVIHPLNLYSNMYKKAEIYPTFTREVNADADTDEWKLGEYSVFWDIYSVNDAVECEMDMVMNNEESLSIAAMWKDLQVGYNQILYGALAFVCVLCACAVISVYCCNDKQRYEQRGYEALGDPKYSKMDKV